MAAQFVEQRQERALLARQISLGDFRLKWMEKTFGDAPAGKHSLWITLHGGGQATTEENDQNWRGYYGRYEFPPGSINVAPRAPVDAWNMWFVKPVDDLLDRLIADMVMERGVDPNQVYLIGYSAGGDGVYQLAWRIALPPPPCAPGIPTRFHRSGSATCRFTSIWAGTTRLIIATLSCAYSARNWMFCRRLIQPVMSIAAPFIPVSGII